MTLKIINQICTPTLSKEKCLRKVSQEFEARFMTEMLKSAKISSTSSSIINGIGNDYYDDYLNEHYANALTQKMQTGLSNGIFLAMKKIGKTQ